MQVKKISKILYAAFPLLFLLLISGCSRGEEESYENYVLLVSFDGFRWDYPDLYNTPNMDKLAFEGVKAQRVISSFPTKTFPNHYSIATGLYPDHHGLINNSFYAPDLDRSYSIGNREAVENPDFYSGEPIWNTAKKQGLITASFFWVGSEAPVGGMQPDYWKRYDGSISYEARIDTVMKWLNFPLSKRPRLILLYFDQPDAVGHFAGPNSEATKEVVEEMDRLLGKLIRKLNDLSFGQRINLILTSDHGMARLDQNKYVNLQDYLSPDKVLNISGGNPVYLIDAADGYEDSITLGLDTILGVSAWRKKDIPSYLNYGSNPRIPDILVLADSGWSIGLNPAMSPKYAAGAHGYDCRNTDMNHIFYANGPDFRDGHIHAVFENVDIYPLIAHILGIEPAPMDGKLERVKGMLK